MCGHRCVAVQETGSCIQRCVLYKVTTPQLLQSQHLHQLGCPHAEHQDGLRAERRRDARCSQQQHANVRRAAGKDPTHAWRRSGGGRSSTGGGGSPSMMDPWSSGGSAKPGAGLSAALRYPLAPINGGLYGELYHTSDVCTHSCCVTTEPVVRIIWSVLVLYAPHHTEHFFPSMN